MIETLARKRINAVALAVLLALVAAMFAVLPHASAVDNRDDRTAEAFGPCVVNTAAGGETNYLLVGDTCTIASVADGVITSSDETIVAGGTAESGGAFTVEAKAVGSVTITDTQEAADATTAVDDVTFKIEVLAAPTVSITFDDSDSTVKAGTDVVATITTRGFSANHTVTVSVPSTGLLFTSVSVDADDPDGSFTAIPTGVTSALLVTSAENGDDWVVPGTGTDVAVDGLTATVTIRTTGAPDGGYPISASVVSQDVDDDVTGETAEGATAGTDDTVIQKASTTATLTVGDAGAGLASATLSYGTRTGSTAEETGTDKAGSDGINLVIESFNSLGAKANPRDVNTIIVSAIGSSSIAIGSNSSSQGALTVTESSATSNDVGQKHTVIVNKSTPGTVDVTATVIGASGVAMTETITLTFSGNPETHSVAAPADALAQENDVYVPAVEAVEGSAQGVTPVVAAVEAKAAVEGGLKFEVTGSDDSGNQSALTTAQITARVLDADDKNVSSKFSITEEIKENSNGVVIVRVGTGSAKLDAGTYTLETKLTGKDTQETEFSVSGAATDVSLEVSFTPDPLELGSLVNVTATVTDGNGTPVADGTLVDFATGGSLTLDKVGSIVDVKTDDGVAKARFIVSKGEGLATIIADAGSATGVATVYLAGAAAAAEPTEPALSDFGNGGSPGLTSYSGPDTTASELMALLSGRGITALWLYNGAEWVLYAQVDGAMAPGAMDFNVKASDVLFLSGN